jgi:alkylated DNA repair protein alkB family protein 1
MLPSLLPPNTQLTLLSRLLHRDLSNPKHKTNIHAHYQVAYYQAAPSPASEAQDEPRHGNIASFFSRSPSSFETFPPKDPATHKPLSVSQFLQRKLRWMTLGGQYDWTKKEYPPELPPPFPVDVADLLHGLFPDMKAQAAIVNLYSPGDTLSVHRDVSEECDRGLISISLGCDCIFTVGLEEEDEKEVRLDGGEIGRLSRNEADSLFGEGMSKRVNVLAIRLRSGDAVYMSGRSRFAWHGVPKIIPATCPEWMQEWPAQLQSENDAGEFEAWRGWMASKRINLNVRQIWE